MCGGTIDNIRRRTLQSCLGSSGNLVRGNTAHITDGMGRDSIGIRVKEHSRGIATLKGKEMSYRHL